MGSSGPSPIISEGFQSPQMMEDLMPLFNQISGVGSGQPSGQTFSAPNGYSQFFNPYSPTMSAQPYIPSPSPSTAQPIQQPPSQQPASIAASPWGNFNNAFDMLFGI